MHLSGHRTCCGLGFRFKAVGVSTRLCLTLKSGRSPLRLLTDVREFMGKQPVARGRTRRGLSRSEHNMLT